MSDELAELRALDRTALVERWQLVFGRPAPRYCHVELLRAALAWEVQALAAGMTKTSRRRIVNTLRQPPRSVALSPGTLLLREWSGRTYRVTVLDQGFDYDGTTYRSLSVIAHAITGTRWSGPRFFGLRH